MTTLPGISVVSFPRVSMLVTGEHGFQHWATTMARGERSLILSPAGLAADAELVRRISDSLAGAVEWRVVPHHTPAESVAKTEELIAGQRIDQVIAIGGGSAIDHMKETRRRLHQHASAQSWTAVPTTLSGAEWSPLIGVTHGASKRVYHSQDAVPDVVIHDGLLAASTPARVWRATAVKAVSSAIERAGSTDATALSLDLVLEGLRQLVNALVEGRVDDTARLELLRASLKVAFLGGGNVRDGVGGALRRAAGAVTGASHGELSSAFLLETFHYNRSHIPRVEASLAEAFRGTDGSSLSVVDGLERLLRMNQLPCALRELGIRRDQLDEIAAEGYGDPGLGGNPRPVHGPEELRILVKAAW